MNLLDIAFCIIAGYFLIRGLFRGFIIEITAIVGVVLAFVLANKYHNALSPYVREYITESGWGGTLAYLVVFVGAIVAATLLGKLLHRVLASPSDLMNTVSGGFIGLTKGALISLVLFMLLSNYLPQAEFMQTSLFAPYLDHVAQSIRPYMPEQLRIENLPQLPEQNKLNS